MSDTYDCIVVGAGPAGLCMGYRLSQSTIRYLVLDKGSIGQSWREMHDSLRLLSPMYVNQLPGIRFPFLRLLEKIPKADFVEYLEEYVRRYEINVAQHTEVTRARKDGEEFALETGNGTLRTKTLVNATGYFFHRYTPEIGSDDHSIPAIHSADYKSPHLLSDVGVPPGGRILIVGKRVSAGQLLEELYQSDYKLGMSTTGPIETRTSGVAGWIRENLYYAREYMNFLFDPYIQRNSLALMDGGETDRIIRSGELALHPTIEAIREGSVLFTDGTSGQYDLVIYATGFREDYRYIDGIDDSPAPLSAHLDCGEHKTIRGLFFIGVDNMISFKSRYVRGVASDSKAVSQRVLSYLGESPETGKRAQVQLTTSHGRSS